MVGLFAYYDCGKIRFLEREGQREIRVSLGSEVASKVPAIARF